jgi:hypothetical protein
LTLAAQTLFKLQTIAQNRPRSETVIALVAIEREISFDQFSRRVFNTTKTRSGPHILAAKAIMQFVA